MATLKELRQRARVQGYLTLGEIRESVPAVEADEAALRQIVERLEEDGFIVHRDGQEGLDDGFGGDVSDIVSLYMRRVGQVPLLTAAEEVDLAQKIEAGEAAKVELGCGVTEERRRELLELVDTGEEARRHFIKANTRLVISVAKKYTGQGVPFLDLIQEGNLGLMKAIERFDWKRGFKFSTYATWWIRQSIARAVANQGRTIRLPAHIGDRLRQLRKACHELYQSLGREPSSEEVARWMETTAEDVDWLQQVARRPLSLERPLVEGEDDDSTLGSFVADEEEPPPGELASNELLRQDVEVMLRSLTPREARIIELRFGLKGRRPHTLREVGEKFGLTRERIRQIEKEALARLRQPNRSARLRDYLAE